MAGNIHALPRQDPCRLPDVRIVYHPRITVRGNETPTIVSGCVRMRTMYRAIGKKEDITPPQFDVKVMRDEIASVPLYPSGTVFMG